MDIASPRITPLPFDERDDRTEELLRSLRGGGDGADLNIFATLARHPRLLKRWSAFGGVLLYGGLLPPRDREVLILRTAWNCRADYEWGQHVRIGRDAGLTDEEIDRCARDIEEEGAGADDAVLLRAADELHDEACISGTTWQALAARYSEPQLLELCMLVGQYHLVAFTLNSVGVQREPGVDGLPE